MMTMMIKMITLSMKSILIRIIKVMGFLSIRDTVVLNMVNPDLVDLDMGNPALVDMDMGNPGLVDMDMGNLDLVNMYMGNPAMEDLDTGNPAMVDMDMENTAMADKAMGTTADLVLGKDVFYDFNLIFSCYFLIFRFLIKQNF